MLNQLPIKTIILDRQLRKYGCFQASLFVDETDKSLFVCSVYIYSYYNCYSTTRSLLKFSCWLALMLLFQLWRYILCTLITKHGINASSKSQYPLIRYSFNKEQIHALLFKSPLPHASQRWTASKVEPRRQIKTFWSPCINQCSAIRHSCLVLLSAWNFNFLSRITFLYIGLRVCSENEAQFCVSMHRLSHPVKTLWSCWTGFLSSHPLSL